MCQPSSVGGMGQQHSCVYVSLSRLHGKLFILDADIMSSKRSNIWAFMKLVLVFLGQVYTKFKTKFSRICGD